MRGTRKGRLLKGQKGKGKGKRKREDKTETWLATLGKDSIDDFRSVGLQDFVMRALH